MLLLKSLQGTFTFTHTQPDKHRNGNFQNTLNVSNSSIQCANVKHVASTLCAYLWRTCCKSSLSKEQCSRTMPNMTGAVSPTVHSHNTQEDSQLPHQKITQHFQMTRGLPNNSIILERYRGTLKTAMAEFVSTKKEFKHRAICVPPLICETGEVGQA